jgi:15-cis-phytoene synthase
MSRQSERELDAAVILDPELRGYYAECRALNSAHGKTYYLATLLLPPNKRPAVHALYGFARWVDDLIDTSDAHLSIPEQAKILDAVEQLFRGGAVDEYSDAPAVRAVLDTIDRWNIPIEYFVAFVKAMRLDLTVTEYATYADLERYMWGSAAVIGLQMLPVLGLQAPLAIVRPYAIDLGVAFQLTNFLRDVGEDLRRGRIYLPQDSLRQHGVDRERLQRGVVDGPIRRLLADEIARTRELYRSAEQGIRLLDPTSRPCVQTAFTLYRGILDEIELAGYAVLQRRVAVPPRRRATGLVRALLPPSGTR